MKLAARVLSTLALAAVAAGAAAAAPAQQLQTKECNGIRECISVPGPWVIVPTRSTATYLLECPYRRGIVGGIDALATSRDVRMWYRANLGAPVSPGMTTTRYAVMHGLTRSGRLGAFKPALGCIPTNAGGRSTTAVKVASPGTLDYAQTTFLLQPGLVRRTTIGCTGSQKLVDTWHAIAFDTVAPPRLGLASAIRVRKTKTGKHVAVTITVSEALPNPAKAQVQVGVVCAS